MLFSAQPIFWGFFGFFYHRKVSQSNKSLLFPFSPFLFGNFTLFPFIFPQLWYLGHLTQEVFDPPMLDVGSHRWGGYSHQLHIAIGQLEELAHLSLMHPSPPSLTQHASLILYILCPYILCQAFTLSQRCPQRKLAQMQTPISQTTSGHFLFSSKYKLCYILVLTQHLTFMYYPWPSVAKSPSVANRPLAPQQLNGSLWKYSGTCKLLLEVWICFFFQKNQTRWRYKRVI